MPKSGSPELAAKEMSIESSCSALQIAIALEVGCEAFLTNDVQLKRVTELKVLVVVELEL
jgi:predicted nucleic acid-binding protein